MPPTRIESDRIEFGDFQTPVELADRVCQLLSRLNLQPRSVVEPTCGEGTLLKAAVDALRPQQAIGLEINASYVRRARRLLHGDATIRKADFFAADWSKILSSTESPLLVIGNPPWVTNSVLGSGQSDNLPTKSNLHEFRGIDAVTGKSNFDISEWMLIHLLESLAATSATMAMLCKTAVARKVLQFLWKHDIHAETAIYRIDAKHHFDAAVDACLFVVQCGAGSPGSQTCDIYESLESTKVASRYGYRDQSLIADVDQYDRYRDWIGDSHRFRWRSGIKHDCSKVMELSEREGALYNGFGDRVEIETEILFPLLKSSDVAGARTRRPKRWMIVPQTHVGEETVDRLKAIAPRTLAYLKRHAPLLEKRRSTIYRYRPPFSIFGVGSYSFSKAKVAVSSLYKEIRFVSVGTYQGKPIVLDDTCYSVCCDSMKESQLVAATMNSVEAKRLLSAFVFPDAKRTVTTGILQRLNLEKMLESQFQST